MSDPKPVLQANDVDRFYQQGETTIRVLEQLQFELMPAERVAIVGRSGSGKSTLLHLLAGLDTPDAGDIRVAGRSISAASANERADIRNQHMGFVYQNHHLLPEFTAVENVAMPLRIAGCARKDAEHQALALLEEVGLADRAAHLPGALSGGERQRVAVARAVAGQPELVLADEPTGNLDNENAAATIALLNSLSERHGTSFVVVTHDTSMLSSFDRVMNLSGGRLELA